MVDNKKTDSMGGIIMTLLVFVNAIILQEALVHDERIYWALTLSVPFLAIAVFNVRQRRPGIKAWV
jgi:hypothetical protein